MIKKTARHAVFVFFLAIFCASYASAPSSVENFLVITDAHLDMSLLQGMAFTPSVMTPNNDLDEPTFKHLLSNISGDIHRGVIASPKFILFLGDMVGHERSVNSVLDSESSFFDGLNKNFPDTPILYVNGNNDSFQIKYGPFTSVDQSGAFKSPATVAKAKGWGDPFLSTGTQCIQTNKKYPCMIVENAVDGYYSAYLEPKLRLIVLNTTMFSTRRAGIAEQDAKKQLNWLEAQLQVAQSNHESVLLAGHIPPGSDLLDNRLFWLPTELAEFLKQVSTYHEIIIGFLASHTHRDEIKIIQDSSNQPSVGVYLTASLATLYGNSPSIRTYYYSKQKEQWHLTDYDSFYFLKDDKNAIVLKKLYNYRDYYCNNQEKDMFRCLKNITVEKIQKYYLAGDLNMSLEIKYPQNMMIK